jgi:hypothetical protein
MELLGWVGRGRGRDGEAFVCSIGSRHAGHGIGQQKRGKMEVQDVGKVGGGVESIVHAAVGHMRVAGASECASEGLQDGLLGSEKVTIR